MIKFQDPRLYVKGTANFVLCDVTTGDVKYQDNKFQTNNITTSANVDPIRGGLGNPAATVIASDSDINVAASSAAFNLFAKAAQVGAQLSYNAITPKCQVIEATGTTLTVDVAAAGAPVAPYGYATPFCYVLEVGVANYVGDAGKAYPITEVGLIQGFNAVSGTSYKVWYWVNKASAQVAALPTQFNPGVYNATAQMAVYANQSGYAEGETGTRVGWLYYVIPLLKLGAVANIVGDQTTPDTTDLSGRALYFDEAVESGICGDDGGGVLAYYIYVPDDPSSNIGGLAVVGGVVTVPTGGTIQVPVKYVMRGGQLVQPNYSDLAYALDGSEPEGTSVSASGVITGGATAGECEITITYPKSGPAEFTTVANVSVTG